MSLSLSWAAAACQPATIQVVGGSDAGAGDAAACPVTAQDPACPAAGQPAPQLRFDSPADPRLAVAPGTVSDLRISCQRSYCGGGALAAHADLTWTPDPQAPSRMATFIHRFDPPVDLMGKTVAFSVYVEDVTAPFHAQVGVIFEFWRWIAWKPVLSGWNRIEGVVSPQNDLSRIDPDVTSIPVTAIQIDVYVPAADASGPTGAWSGEIYLDDIGWR